MKESERLTERLEKFGIVEMHDINMLAATREAAALLRSQAEELERLRSDITRQMAIANSECNRAERLRELLECALDEYESHNGTNNDARHWSVSARAALGER